MSFDLLTSFLTRAESIFYDNTSSGLSATNVNDAIDEVASEATLWQRTGTILSPVNSGDDLSIPAGNIGIGLDSASSLLHVKGTGGFSEGIILESISTTAGSSATIKLLRSRSGGPCNDGDSVGFWGFRFINSATTEKYGAIIESLVSDVTDSTEDAYLTFWTMGDGSITEKMRLTGTGYLGIGTNTPNTSLDVQGGQTVKVTTVNAATYDLLVTDYILNVTYTTTGAVTSLTLPTAQTVSGRVIHINDAGGNASTNSITIDTEGSQKINGLDTYSINGDNNSVSLYCDGSNWFDF
jgi:hypothetical protein